MNRNLLLVALLLLQLPVFAQQSLLRNEAADLPAELPESPLPVATLPANGVVNGFHSEGRYRYAGKMRNKKLHGSWQSWYSTAGSYEEGRFSKGIPDGSWKVWYENGQLKFLRTYSSDKYRRMLQEFVHPNPRMILYPITNLYIRNRQAALQELNAFSHFADNESESPYLPLFNEALLHGPYATYNEDGTVRDSGQYSNGLREGIWIETDASGNRWKGRYQHGLRTGSWKYTDANETVLKLMDYRNGVVEWEKSFK